MVTHFQNVSASSGSAGSATGAKVQRGTVAQGQVVLPTPLNEGDVLIFGPVQLLDDAGNMVTAAMLSALTLTVWSQYGFQVVNGIDHVGILNAGRGALDGQGFLTITLGTADMAILNSQVRDEVHGMNVDALFLDGRRLLVLAVLFTVRALYHARKRTSSVQAASSAAAATLAELKI